MCSLGGSGAGECASLPQWKHSLAVAQLMCAQALIAAALSLLYLALNVLTYPRDDLICSGQCVCALVQPKCGRKWDLLHSSKVK